jgi:membrane protease YdiL (CAAX protease family)
MDESGLVRGLVAMGIANLVLLLLCLLVGLLLRFVARRSLGRLAVGMGHGMARNFLEGAGWGLAALAVTIVPAWIGGGYAPGEGYRSFAAEMDFGSFDLMWLFFSLQTLLEELVFRAMALTLLGLGFFGLAWLLMRWLLEEIGPIARHRAWLFAGCGANLSVALVFGLVHLSNPNVSALATVNIVLAGTALGQLQWNRGNVLGPWAMHWVWNATIATVGLPISGIAVEPSIAALGIAGARGGWLAGGAFGPEGSIFCTVALGAVTILLMVEASRARPAGEASAVAAASPAELVEEGLGAALDLGEAPAELEVNPEEAAAEEEPDGADEADGLPLERVNRLAGEDRQEQVAANDQGDPEKEDP